VFVFPSKTDTFGVVQLEALACGVSVAAYPVMGPRDVIGGSKVGLMQNAAMLRRCIVATRLCDLADNSLERSLERALDQLSRRSQPRADAAQQACGRHFAITRPCCRR